MLYMRKWYVIIIYITRIVVLLFDHISYMDDNFYGIALFNFCKYACIVRQKFFVNDSLQRIVDIAHLIVLLYTLKIVLLLALIL